MRQDQFAEKIREALGGRPQPDPMEKLRADLDKLRARTVELTEGIEKLAAEIGANR